MTSIKYIQILILFILIFGCKSNEITIRYVKVNNGNDMVADKSKESVTVFLESYFNGTVKGYVGNQLVFDEKIETEESLGTTENHFFYDYSINKKLPAIRIEADNTSAEIKIKKNYKLIFVYKHNSKWEIIYSNNYPTYE